MVDVFGGSIQSRPRLPVWIVADLQDKPRSPTALGNYFNFGSAAIVSSYSRTSRIMIRILRAGGGDRRRWGWGDLHGRRGLRPRWVKIRIRTDKARMADLEGVFRAPSLMTVASRALSCTLRFRQERAAATTVKAHAPASGRCVPRRWRTPLQDVTRSYAGRSQARRARQLLRVEGRTTVRGRRRARRRSCTVWASLRRFDGGLRRRGALPGRGVGLRRPPGLFAVVSVATGGRYVFPRGLRSPVPGRSTLTPVDRASTFLIGDTSRRRSSSSSRSRSSETYSMVK